MAKGKKSIWPKQIIAPAIGINGTQGVRNCRSRSGLVFRRTTTLKQTIVKASNVPMETIELRTSIGRTPARTAAHKPVNNVGVVGVRNFG